MRCTWATLGMLMLSASLFLFACNTEDVIEEPTDADTSDTEAPAATQDDPVTPTPAVTPGESTTPSGPTAVEDDEIPPTLEAAVDEALQAAQQLVDAGDLLGAADLLDRRLQIFAGTSDDPAAAQQRERLQAMRDTLQIGSQNTGATELQLMRLQQEAMTALEANDLALARETCDTALTLLSDSPGMEEWESVFRDILRRTTIPGTPPPEDGWGE